MVADFVKYNKILRGVGGEVTYNKRGTVTLRGFQFEKVLLHTSANITVCDVNSVSAKDLLRLSPYSTCPNLNDGVNGPTFLFFSGGKRIDVSDRNDFHNTIKKNSLVL